jgi:hypothetical protein
MRPMTQQDLIDIRTHFPLEDCLPAPDLEVSSGMAAAFDALYDKTTKKGAAAVISYQLPYPKYLFLDYLARSRGLMLHGSQVGSLDMLKPIRNTRDSSEFGDQAAIYATQDPLWALFFAVLDRNAINGVISNGAIHLQVEGGAYIRRYFYCVDAPSLKSGVWKSGTLYLMKGEGFEADPNEVGLKIGIYTMIPTHWIHRGEQPVLARLPVEPQDFPFYQQVWGYDPEEMDRRMEAPSLTGWPFLSDPGLYPIRPK